MKTRSAVLVLVLSLGLAGCMTASANQSAVEFATMAPANDSLGILSALTTDERPQSLEYADSIDGESTTMCRTGVSVAVPEGYSLKSLEIGMGESRQVILDDSIVEGMTAFTYVAGHEQSSDDLESEVQGMANSGRTSALSRGATDVRGMQIAWPTSDYAYLLSWRQDAGNVVGDIITYNVRVLYLGSERHRRTAVGAIWVPIDDGSDHPASRAVQTLRFC